MPNKTRPNNLTKEDQDQAQFLGRKLGFLIAASNLSSDIKNAWFTILPELSLEQLARFIDILESKYLDEETQDINQELEQDLKEIQEKHEKQRQELNADVLEKIKKLEKQVDAASKSQTIN
ncbi:hypothetical protein HQ544_01450 [Candidatus Falkowbacteria bacterium]|nr:hypothetical protein [Candidatus Falkowbacteria bacterium]